MHHSRTRCTWIAAAVLLILDPLHAADSPPSTAASSAPKKILDLRPPNINTILTPEQISAILNATIDPDIERIEVEDSREKLIDEGTPLWRSVPSWILPHDRESADKKYGKPDATMPHARPPAAAPPPMAGEPRAYDR